MAKQLTYSITGVSAGDLINAAINESYNTPCRGAVLAVEDTTLELGDTITINVGYDDSNTKVFYGYVEGIERSTPTHEITITCQDILTKAVNFFIASDDPEEPIEYSNIKSEDYVENILALAEITVFEADVPQEFIWATDLPAEVNLLTAWSAANEMAQMLAWHIHADRDGKTWFTDRRPYIQGGDSADFTWDETAGINVLSLMYRQSTEETRNKVVVYGREGINATASQARGDILYSATYYKTAVIAHPLIQTQSQAQTTADYNLELYNRLTESISLSVEGDPDIEVNKIADITGSTFTTVSGLWFIYQCNHRFGQQGYTTDMVLTK